MREDTGEHSTTTDNGSADKGRGWLWVILALALTLRMFHLGSDAYWHDEVHNLIKSENLPAVLLKGDLVSNHPPLFVILLAAWRAFVPVDNEWTTRLVSVFLGMGGVVAIYAAGKEFFGVRTARWAAFLLAICPFHILHSQDLKAYIILPFTGTLAVLALYRAVEGNRWRSWGLYALLAAVACYSENHAGPLLVGVNLWVLYNLRRYPARTWRWIAANGLGALFYIPHLIILMEKVNLILVKTQNLWVHKPTPASVFFYLKTVAFGYSDSFPLYLVALGFYLVVAGMGIRASFRRDRRIVWLLVCWCVIPIGLTYAVSCLSHNSIFLIRAMLVYAVPFYLAVAYGTANIRKVSLRRACALGFALLAGIPLAQHYKGVYPLKQWPHRPGVHWPTDNDLAAYYVDAHWEEGDILVHSAAFTWLPFYWYGFRDRPQFTVGTNQGVIDHVGAANIPTATTKESARRMSGWHMRQLQPTVRSRRRVWFVFSDWHREYLDVNAVPVWLWLEAHYTEVRHECFKGLEVFLFVQDDQGHAFSETKWDNDDGASALVSRVEPEPGKSERVRPDAGLAQAPLEARRGALRLSFTSSSDDEQQTVFEVVNSTDKPVACRVDCLSSDALLNLPSFYETTASSDVWSVTSMGAQGVASAQCDTPVVSGWFEEPGGAGLDGVFTLPCGAYRTFAMVRRVTDPAAGTSAKVFLDVGQQRVLTLGAVPELKPLPQPWQWIETAPVLISDHLVPAHLTSVMQEESLPGSIDIGPVAFVRRRAPADEGELGPLQTFYDVVLMPMERRQFVANVRPRVPRVDVWVHEEPLPGRVYHIFGVRNPSL